MKKKSKPTKKAAPKKKAAKKATTKALTKTTRPTRDATYDLTDKQRAFAIEYVKDFNGTQAAIRAGYSKNGANVAAVRLLSNATIREILGELILTASNEGIATLEEALQMATDIMRDKDDVKPGDRIRAIERLAKMRGWDAAEKHEITGQEITVKLPKGVEL